MDHRNGSIVRQLAHQLLTREECQILKKALKAFRYSRSVTSLVTSLLSIITDSRRMLLLLELSYMMPAGLQDDFHRLCTMHFPGYRELKIYLKPDTIDRESKEKVIAQNESGTIQIVGDNNEKKIVKGMNIKGETGLEKKESNLVDMNPPRGSAHNRPARNRKKASVSSYSDTESDYSGHREPQTRTSQIYHGHPLIEHKKQDQGKQVKQRRHVSDPHRIVQRRHFEVNHDKIEQRQRSNVINKQITERLDTRERENQRATPRSTHRSRSSRMNRSKSEDRLFHRDINVDIDLQKSIGYHEKKLSGSSNTLMSTGVQKRSHKSRSHDLITVGQSEAQRFSELANNVEINTRYSNTARSWRDLRKVSLLRRPGESLGFCIRGGHELHTGIYVSSLDPGGQAEKQGLRIGDRVFKVNNFNFRRITHSQAVQAISELKDKIVMYVTSAQSHKMPGRIEILHSPHGAPEEPVEREIVIKADPDGWLGCSIRGGVDQNLEVIVSNVDPDSPAERAGLKKRDKIIKLNGMNVSNLMHLQVVNLATISPDVGLVVIPGTKIRKKKALFTQDGPQTQNIRLTAEDSQLGTSRSDSAQRFEEELLMSPTATTSTPNPSHDALAALARRRSRSLDSSLPGSQGGTSIADEDSNHQTIVVADVHAEHNTANSNSMSGYSELNSSDLDINGSTGEERSDSRSDNNSPNGVYSFIPDQQQTEEDITSAALQNEVREPPGQESETGTKHWDKFISGTIKKNLDISEDFEEKLTLHDPFVITNSPANMSRHEHVKNIFQFENTMGMARRSLFNVPLIKAGSCSHDSQLGKQAVIEPVDDVRDLTLGIMEDNTLDMQEPEKPVRYTIWSSKENFDVCDVMGDSLN